MYFEKTESSDSSSNIEADRLAFEAENPVDRSELRLETPKILAEKYQLHREIGHGAQGKVYLAKRLSDQNFVAIKELRIDSLQNWKSYDLFWREVNTLKSLDIDGVAKFYDVVESLDDNVPCAYLVHQYIQGHSLAEMIRNGYRFDVKTIFNIALQILTILEKLHHHEPPIVHRDIKPSNIMIEQAESGFKVYLIDFGAVANPLLQKGGSTVAGTYGYMPPEQLMGKPVPASDIYALGAMIAGLLSGMEPGEMDIVDYRLAIEVPLENLPYPVVSCLREMVQPKLENRTCDYDSLRTRFKAFSEGKFFDNSYQPLKVQSKKAYFKSLKKIVKLGTGESYELWNVLPEATPRKIPWSYRRIFWVAPPLTRILIHNIKVYFRESFHDLFRFLSPAYFIYSPLRWFFLLCFQIPFWIFISAVIIAIVVLIVYCVWIVGALGYLLWIDGAVLGGLAVFGGMIICICIICIRSYRKYKPLRDVQKDFNNLLVNGRKTMARIVDVWYVVVEPDIASIQSLSDRPYGLLAMRLGWKNGQLAWKELHSRGAGKAYQSIYNYSNPRIRVTYAFNPPDDSSDMDIIHSITIPADSEKSLKPGSLLPILYLVDNDGFVDSVPFPVPVRKPVHIEEMVFSETLKR